MSVQEYRNDAGKLHRVGGPAHVVQYPDGDEEHYYNNGIHHRIGGPAVHGPNYTEYWLEGQLHRDGGPSVVYHKGDEDGNGLGQELYHLHGVIVTKELSMMTDEEFQPSVFFKEKNVEVRREIIRKFGIERIFTRTNKRKESYLKVGEGLSLDVEGDYELFRICLGTNLFGTYLKMKNPSIDAFHMEGVPHEIKTVKDAISWRNHGLIGPPEILS